MLDAAELRAVLAHEAGHVLSEHVRYRTTLELLLRFTVPRMPLMGRVPLQALVTALLAWYRAAELSCDRAAALVLRDPLVPCRTLMKLAGGGLEGLSLDAFLRQADEYVEWDDLFDRHQRLGRELAATHPFPVRRVYELTRWVKSGEYDRVIGGEYVHRGEEPPPSAEFRAAVDHYTERFGEVLERTAGGIGKMSKQFTRWLGVVRSPPRRGRRRLTRGQPLPAVDRARAAAVSGPRCPGSSAGGAPWARCRRCGSSRGRSPS